MGMQRYIAKRVAHSFFVVYFVATIVFLAVRAIPGDPVRLMLGGEASPEARQALRQELGLNQPVYVQYVRWLAQIFQGDFGDSILSGEPVFSLIVGVAEPTVSIAAVGMILAFGIALPTGIVSAVRRYTAEDYASTVIAFFGISMPGFWIGIILILLVGVRFEAIPTFGYTSLGQGVGPWLASVILPSLAVALPNGGLLMRMVRSSMLEVLSEDYMTTARAKGLDERLVLFKHGVQNAMIPVVTYTGILFAVVLAGVVAVEIVFGVRGMGRLLIGSINRRDFPVVQGTVILISFVFVLVNLVVDVLYTVINPRIKYGGGD